MLFFYGFPNLFPISLPGRPDPGADKKATLFIYGGAAFRRFAHIRSPELQLKVDRVTFVLHHRFGPYSKDLSNKNLIDENLFS